MKSLLFLAGLAVTAMLPGVSVAASVSAFIFERGGDVILEYSGSIDTTGFGTDFTDDTNGTQIAPGLGIFGAFDGPIEFFSVDFLGFTSFGTGNFVELGTGMGAGLYVDNETGTFGLPPGYVSQTPFMGSGAITGTTLDEIGAEVGRYVYRTVDSIQSGLVTNTITLTVGSPTPIPLPGTLPMLAAGLGGLALWRLRRG